MISRSIQNENVSLLSFMSVRIYAPARVDVFLTLMVMF